jgi:hypothetical protein
MGAKTRVTQPVLLALILALQDFQPMILLSEAEGSSAYKAFHGGEV